MLLPALPRRGRLLPRAGALAAVVLLMGAEPSQASARTAERVSGPDRYATAVAISQQEFREGSEVVVVVSGAAFPDALAAAPAAGAFDAPVLLVPPGGLPEVVSAEVRRLGARTALVVGGASAVGAEVVASLRSGGLDVARVSGADRYATAADLATRVVSPGASPHQVLVASGTVFADGLAGGAYGAATGAPLLLTAPDALPAATAAALTALAPGSVVVLGGPSAVSDAVLARIDGLTDAPVRRVAGEDRYATAASVQLELWQSAPAALLTSGTAFPDALAAGGLGRPMLLSRPDCLPASTEAALGDWGTGSVIALGGTAALSDAAASGSACG